MNDNRGPVEDLSWATTLKARVVTPGARPRIHGYDVRGDLLTNTGIPGVLLLILTGELPTKAAAMAFEKVMVFLAPVSVAEAPVHASVLAGLCGSDSCGRAGVAAITLAQQARFTVAEHRDLLMCLTKGHLPENRFEPANETDAEETTLLLKALKDEGVSFPDEFKRLAPTAAALAVLQDCCGLTTTEQLEQVLLMARIPCTLAEAGAVKPGDFREYPIELPRFEYTDGE